MKPRCRNCGLREHLTQHCPRYGPWFPEPGKTAQDYGDEAERIANLVAVDIIREHEGHDEDDEIGEVSRPSTRLSEVQAQRRSYFCETCNANPGEPCVSGVGRPIGKVHANRLWKWKRDQWEAMTAIS